MIERLEPRGRAPYVFGDLPESFGVLRARVLRPLNVGLLNLTRRPPAICMLNSFMAFEYSSNIFLTRGSRFSIGL